jgi:hypothetical protein
MEPVALAEAMDCTAPDTASPIVSEAGDYLMKYYNPGRIMTRCNQYDYIFITEANICASWVKEEHLGCIQNKKGGCCGQRRPGVFSFANASDARRWTNRGGR